MAPAAVLVATAVASHSCTVVLPAPKCATQRCPDYIQQPGTKKFKIDFKLIL